jgi:hypothetical protein
MCVYVCVCVSERERASDIYIYIYSYIPSIYVCVCVSGRRRLRSRPTASGPRRRSFLHSRSTRYVCAYVYVHVYEHVYVYVYVCEYVLCVMCACMYMCKYDPHTHTHTHIHTYTRTYIDPRRRPVAQHQRTTQGDQRSDAPKHRRTHAGVYVCVCVLEMPVLTSLFSCLYHNILHFTHSHSRTHTHTQRGETLDDLMDRSEDLSSTSVSFYRTAKRNNQCCKAY